MSGRKPVDHDCLKPRFETGPARNAILGNIKNREQAQMSPLPRFNVPATGGSMREHQPDSWRVVVALLEFMAIPINIIMFYN
jgi:hypothetical protein